MSPREIPQAELAAIQETYERGQYLDAWHRVERFGAPEQWCAPSALILAGRIIGNLENEPRALALYGRAWRLDRRNPETAYYRAFAIERHLGPLCALRFIERLPDLRDAAAEIRASVLAQRARLLATFRDFYGADTLHAEAVALDGRNPWIWIERAWCLERADRYQDALDAAHHALTLRPLYRPAVQCAAHHFGLLGRDDEAITLLHEASQRLQSSAVVAQLASLLADHDRHAEALVLWRRYRALALLISQPALEWWHARMSDTHYALGAVAAAAAHARLAKNGFHEKIAVRLAPPPATPRVVRLPVPFVRQHEMTCSPATLSALSHYWNAPVDHLALAREICYDGTQGHKEYDWAQRNGYVVRLFTVTWDAARALLDRGIPFTLATVQTTSAHLQAVVGYDAVRGTIFLRDPFLKHHVECICPDGLDCYAFCGPRGMALVPYAEAGKLDGLELPDTPLWEHLHTVERALYLHDRPRATESLAALEAVAPGHAITLNARRALAWYDGDQPRALAATEALLMLFPESPVLCWARYGELRNLARRTDHRALLEKLARRPGADPVFWRELAEELRTDARALPRARSWALRALRRERCEAENLRTMANLLWDERRFTEALSLYRLAAHLRDKVACLQHSWFAAARHLRRADEVLGVFARRFETDGPRSPQPALILYGALTQLHRTVEALTVLDRAIALRPDDGELLTFAADAYARCGRHDVAAALLERADGRCARAEWLRCAARMADYRGDLPTSLQRWREVLVDSPLDLDGLRTAARLTAEVDGRDAALAFLAETIARFPHHIPLRELHIEWLREEGPAAQGQALRELLEMAPTNTWALRELAGGLSDLQRHEEALASADAAVALGPQDPANHSARGRALFHAGRLAESAAACREAITRAVDYSPAIEGLLATCGTFEEKRAALAFILNELKRQVVFGDGLFGYVAAAFPVLDHAELLDTLREAHAARPDLWHAWSVLITQLCNAGQATEALPLARECAERFPLVPAAWMDLARAHFAQGSPPAEVDVLRRACELNPSWGVAARALADALQRCGRYDEIVPVLEQAITSAPLDPFNRGYLADYLWGRGRDPRAITLLEDAIRLAPGYGWAWHALRSWAETPDRAVAVARDLTRMRGGEPGSWLRLAEMLPDDKLDERLAALVRAVNLNPRLEDAYDIRAVLLANAGRYDEALAACAPHAYGDALPRALRARAAWVMAARGNLVGAVAAMREILAEEPDYYWAWERLAECCDQLGDHESVRAAAAQMSRLEPRKAAPLGWLADAAMKLGKREEAIANFERAFALDPTYAFAALALFNAHLKAGSLDQAEAVLARMRIHLPGPETVAAGVALRTRRRDLEGALEEIDRLVWTAECDASAVEHAGSAIRQAGWGKEFEAHIDRYLDSAEANPALGNEWARSVTERGAWGRQTRLMELDPASKLGQRAWRQFLLECGRNKKLRHTRVCIRWRRTALRATAGLWGVTGYALASCGRHREAAEWLADWRTREGVEPWMLANVADAADALGRFREALEATRRALTLRYDSSFPVHTLRLAYEDATAGDFADARGRLNGLRYEVFDDDNKALWALTTAGCAVGEAAADGRRAEYKKQVGILKANVGTALRRSKPLRRIAGRIVRRMALDAGFALPRLRARASCWSLFGLR